MAIEALLYVSMPITAFVGGVLAYASLRSGLDWSGIRKAALILAAPYAVGFPLGGSRLIHDLVFAGLAGQLSPLVIVAAAAGVLWRWVEEVAPIAKDQ